MIWQHGAMVRWVAALTSPLVGEVGFEERSDEEPGEGGQHLPQDTGERGHTSLLSLSAQPPSPDPRLAARIDLSRQGWAPAPWHGCRHCGSGATALLSTE
ncbi:hypothetical protein SAMN05519103_01470 [Rhizobiales bacterium GAS113]|nr:hypothetical protein SAMN05519103_01470 [Rhizobiales bacterium GAS113]